MNAAQFFGRVFAGALSDYYGGADMLLLAQLFVGILGLHWITISSVGGLVEFVIFIGFASGGVATLPPVVISFLNPDKAATLGTRIGIVYAAAGLGVLVGNPIALATVPRSPATGSDGFLGAQLFMGLCALTGGAFFILPARVVRNNWKKLAGGIAQSPLLDVLNTIQR